jgi:hypothetical protein
MGELNKKRRREKDWKVNAIFYNADSNEPSAHLIVNLIKVHSVYNTILGELKRKGKGLEGRRYIL